MKTSKKILSLVLSIIMVAVMFVPATAAVDQSVVCPEIRVPGFVSSVIYKDKNDPASALGVPGQEEILDCIKNDVVPALIKYLTDKDAEKLGESVAEAVNTQFGDWFNNPDGSAKENAGTNFVYPAKEKVKYNSKFSFRYDWRGDPIENAAQLNDFINYILECTGKDKVALTSHSQGSVVVLAYLSVYGSDKVMGVVLDTPAIDGLASVGELFSGRTDFDGEGIASILKMIIGTTEYEELLSSIIDIFSMAGINDSLSEFLDGLYEKIGPTLLRKSLLPLFGCWPSVWSMIPDRYVYDIMDYFFENDFSGEEYAGLKTKIENFNKTVRANKKQTLLDFDEVGRMAVVTRYGYKAVPVTKEWMLLSDSVIETSSSSLGATTAIVGEYFSDEYLEGKDMKYISPDRTVDASTCLFPEKTWFIKNAYHSENEVTEQFYDLLLFSKEEATCDNSEMSRFMLYDRENGEVVTDESVPVKAEKPTMFDRIFNFIKAIINKLIDFFRK